METFRQAGVNPYDMKTLEENQDFPLLNKEQYRENIEQFFPEGTHKALLIRAYTGGTTGSPTPLYRIAKDFAREQAYKDYVYQMLGIDPFYKSVYIRGTVDDKRGRYHYVGNFGKTLYLSANALSGKNLGTYVNLIRDFKPRLLYALPSTATILAEFMERHQIAPFKELSWAFCPSENLYDFQITLIEKILQCHVRTAYGHAEHAIRAGQCAKNEYYHIIPQYGYSELVDEKGQSVTREGKSGEIVGTAFTNLCCPLIRYRTGDYAKYTEQMCSCGRNYQLWKEIQGRGQAVAIAKNGSQIPIGTELLCTIHDKSYGKIRQFKIEQFKAGQLIVYSILNKKCDRREVQMYFNRVFADSFPGKFDVQVKAVEQFEPGGSSKHLYFVQHVNTS